MSDFKKQGRILLKRNGFWILLTFLITILMSGIFQTRMIESDYKELISATNEMHLLNKDKIKYSEGREIDSKFLKENDELFEKLGEKYQYKYIRDFDFDNAKDEEIDKYYKLQENSSYQILSSYDFIRNNLKTYNNFQIKNLSFLFGFIFIVILSFLFTSIEHATGYYEFSSMYPWTRKKDFLMKLVYGLVGVFIFALVTSVFDYLILKTSMFDITSQNFNLISNLWRLFLALASTFIAFLSVGELSGNILGHIGLAILAFFFIDIVDFVITRIAYIFGFNITIADRLMNSIDSSFKNSPAMIDFLKTFLDPAVKVVNSLASYFGLFAFSILCLVIALIFIPKIKTEKSGLMVLIKPIEILAKTLIILLFSVIGVLFFQDVFMEGFSIVNIFIFALLIFAFYKLFNILFKIKLKV